MIKHLIFDFGGVILDLDGVHTGYPADLAIIFDIPAEKAVQLWNENKTQVMTGKETPKEFLIRMKKEHHFDFDVENGIRYWENQNSIDESRIDWELVEYIQELKNRYHIHMLTDQIELKNGAGLWIDKLETHFHTIFRSYEQGLRKPFPESYHNVLQKINASHAPESVVFIDDSQSNIEAANKIGINGILYTFKNRSLLDNAFKKLNVF